MRIYQKLSNILGQFELSSTEFVFPAKRSTLATACHTYLESLCFSGRLGYLEPILVHPVMRQNFVNTVGLVCKPDLALYPKLFNIKPKLRAKHVLAVRE